MKSQVPETYSSHIPLLQASGELLRENLPSRVIQSSVETNWGHVVMEEHQMPTSEWPDLMFKDHLIAVNVGGLVRCQFKKNGAFQQVLKTTGTISIFPSGQPFYLRMEMDKDQVADLILLALDPGFVNQAAENIGLPSERLELVEQRRLYDPTVLHLRVSKARHLLESGEMTIVEAACEVGFADQSHLTRHFRRVFGLPPKALLRSLLETK